MEIQKRRLVVPLIMCFVALSFFFRSPGAETIRWVQILLLFVAGMCAGVALTAFRMTRGGGPPAAP